MVSRRYTCSFFSFFSFLSFHFFFVIEDESVLSLGAMCKRTMGGGGGTVLEKMGMGMKKGKPNGEKQKNERSDNDG